MPSALITHFDLDPWEKEELERIRALAESRGEYLHIEIRKETSDSSGVLPGTTSPSHRR